MYRDLSWYKNIKLQLQVTLIYFYFNSLFLVWLNLLSTLIWVMAYGQTAPSHCLNQCSYISNKIYTSNVIDASILWISIKIYFKMTVTSTMDQSFKGIYCIMFQYCQFYAMSAIILWLRPTNERWRYNVTSSLIGWAHPQKIHVCDPSELVYHVNIFPDVCTHSLTKHWLQLFLVSQIRLYLF